MASGQDSVDDLSAIQVAVRVRPLNDRERSEGHRTCVSLDDPSKQVVLTAVDKNTLLQLRGATAKGYAFDRRYTQEVTSDTIYDDSVSQLIENCFKGYNATVLAYGQTGSGKTHTMSGGIGIHGKLEEGITPRVIRHIFSIIENLKKKCKPGEKTEVTACALELYNEDLLDLSVRSGKEEVGRYTGWDAGSKSAGTGLKLQERPIGKDGRVIPEVVGVREVKVTTAEELYSFFTDCMENRSTSSTKLNDRSSRSHAIFTISIHRTMVEVMNELGDDFKARVRTVEFTSKLHLVDLAGSERVKRSGVTGKELKEATHINSGLLALGNVIVALASEADTKKKGHIPYRDSKLTRLLQDSLGGNSLTVLISCISPSEMDFEETNNTLKYANRACHIKNTPLPAKFTMLEEDLLPSVPLGAAGGFGLVHLQTLLEDHERLKEMRERKDREKKEKEAKRIAALVEMRDEMAKRPGYQRLRAHQYDELRRQLAAKGVTIPTGQVIGDDVLVSFGRMRLAQSTEGPLIPDKPSTPPSAQNRMRASHATLPRRKADHHMDGSSNLRRSHAKPTKPGGSSFQDWLSSQQPTEDAAPSPLPSHVDDDEVEENAGDIEDFIVDDEDEDAGAAEPTTGAQDEGLEAFIVDDEEETAAPEHAESSVRAEDEAAVADEEAAAGAVGGRARFRRGPASKPGLLDEVPAMSQSASAVSMQAGASELDACSMDVQASEMGATGATGGRRDVEDEDAEVELGEAEEEEVHIDENEVVDALPEDDEDEEEEPLPFDPIQDNVAPKLLARFKVNTSDTLAVFKAVSKEDFKDVIGLLPENTPLPASDKMTYLLARLEVGGPSRDLGAALGRVAANEITMNEAVGPAVGCLMATFGTNMISSCIFEFDDPSELKYYGVEERIELWGLQIPHNSVRPTLTEEGDVAVGVDGKEVEGTTITWTSVDRLNMSIGLLYALCNHALDSGIRCGFCVPRPQLLRRWLQAGVRMRAIAGSLRLIYPPTAHDYEYYKASTVAYFMVAEVKDALEKVLGVVAA